MLDKELEPVADRSVDSPAADILRRMIAVDIEVGVQIDPDDAITRYPVSDDFYHDWTAKRFESLVRAAAAATGEDPDQIANKDTRTPEQQRALMEAAARDIIDRIDSYLNSNYTAAVKHLSATFCKSDDPADERETEHYTMSFQRCAAQYFFATNPGIRPTDANALTAAHYDELEAIFNRLRAFYDANPSYKDKPADFLRAFIQMAHPQDARETYERLAALATITPKYHVMPNNKLSNRMTMALRNPADVVKFSLDVAKRGAKNRIVTTCVLSYEGDNVKLSGRQPYTNYDRSVYEAIVSLYVAGNASFTAAMVFRAMTGKTSHEKPTAGQLSAITRSIDKMRFIRAQIDCSDEFKARNITIDGTKIKGGGYDAYLLPLDVNWVTTDNGATVKAYKFLSSPVLYEYSNRLGQVVSVPLALLDVKKLDKNGNPSTQSLAYTEQRVTLKGYLLRRIEGMKGKSKMNNHVVYADYMKDGQLHQGLYSIAGHPELSQPQSAGITPAEVKSRQKAAQAIRDDVRAILSYWQKTGYITSFSEYKEKKSIKGVEIVP